MPRVRINNHDMYYEIHGEGPPLICSGGWGTFCHGGERHIPDGLIAQNQVILFDHRGIAESDDDASIPASTALYAEDVIDLITHLALPAVHLVGIIGIGACIFQEVAIRRPDLVRSMVNSGAWARVDTYFQKQMELWLDIHRQLGFTAFQQKVVLEGFDAEFVNARWNRLIGPEGPWSELKDNLIAHERFTAAAISHDTVDRLSAIEAPTMIIHTGRDQMTGPRLSDVLDAGIPNATRVRFEDAPHVITDRDDRARFARSIVEFVAQH